MTKAVFRRRRHPDTMRYVVFVLWLVGYSQRTIGTVVGMRPKQVAGIIANSDYANRCSMSEAQRSTALHELEAIRFDEDGEKLDGGMLDRIAFTVKPLATRQYRGALRRKVNGHAG